MDRSRIIVGMSGGVDSSTAAALLKQQGCDVIGVHFRVPSLEVGCTPSRSCCGSVGLEDARRVAAKLAIPFYALNGKAIFEHRVTGPFFASYARGETPNPCVECNRWIKFGYLLDVARAIGAEYVATGHYARLSGCPPVLMKGVEPEREQSYFLYSLSPEQLAHAMFPLGAMTKRQVRELSRSFHLPVAEKPGSQDICFLGAQGYHNVLAARYPEAFQEGSIVNTQGRVLGTHRGIGGFTVGQKRGLRIATGVPLYVVAIHPATRTIVVGPREALLQERIVVGQTNWTACTPPTKPLDAAAKVRYRQPEQPVTLLPLSNARVEVRFHTPQAAAAPGQSAVFYQGDIVMGGGIIMSPEEAT